MAQERNFAYWVKRLVFGAFLGIIALSFAITGTGDIFSTMSNRAVAVVGKEEISVNDYAAEYERAMSRITNQEGRRLSTEQAKERRVDEDVLSTLVRQRTVLNEAEALGVVASDASVVKAIKSIDAFKGLMGDFDQANYQQLVQQIGFTPQGFEKAIRSDITTSQLSSNIVSGLEVPPALARAIIVERLQRRSGSYVVLAPDLAGQIPAPDEDALRAHYEDTILGYNVPESRDVTLLLMSPASYKDTIKVNEDEIRQIYDMSILNYTTPERRTIERIYGTREEMEEAQNRLKAGETMLQIGLSLGLTQEEIQLGTIDKSGIPDADVGRAAFEAPGTGVVGPVEGLSWSLVRVLAIEPEVVQPYQEVKPEITELVVEREAEAEMINNLESIEEGIASGLPLEEIATGVGLQTVQVKGLLRSGLDTQGTVPANLPAANEEIIKETFASPKNFASELIEYGDNAYFVARVDEIYPSAPKPFEEVKGEVEASWRAQERQNRLVKLATEMVTRGNEGVPFETLADEVGRGVIKTTTPLARDQDSGLFSREMVQRAFAVQPGTYIASNVAMGESVVVFRVDEIVDPSDAIIDQYVGVIKDQLDQTLQQDAQQLYLQGLQKKYPNKINPKAIALVTGDVQQSGQ